MLPSQKRQQSVWVCIRQELVPRRVEKLLQLFLQRLVIILQRSAIIVGGNTDDGVCQALIGVCSIVLQAHPAFGRIPLFAAGHGCRTLYATGDTAAGFCPAGLEVTPLGDICIAALAFTKPPWLTIMVIFDTANDFQISKSLAGQVNGYSAHGSHLLSQMYGSILFCQQEVRVDDLEADVAFDISHDNALTLLAVTNHRVSFGILHQLCDGIRQRFALFNDRDGANAVRRQQFLDFRSRAFAVRENQVERKQFVAADVILVALNLVAANLTL